jgi:indoleamine 2,3-dioxygenase
MEYAGSYALFNYRLEDPSRGLEYDNLRLIRAFEHGLDPTSSEAGFVLVHIAMVKESGALVAGASEMLESCLAKDRERFNDGLRTLVGGLRNVNAVMNSKCTAWKCVLATDEISHVEPQQASRVHKLPDFHLRHYFPIDVS